MLMHRNRGLLLFLLCAITVGAALFGPSRARADLPTPLTLTNADNGATVNAAIGDTVVLKLDTSLNWTVSLDNPSMLFSPPVALIAGVQSEWEVIGTGQVTISATGDPPCRQATPPCGAPSQGWQATITVPGTLHTATRSA